MKNRRIDDNASFFLEKVSRGELDVIYEHDLCRFFCVVVFVLSHHTATYVCENGDDEQRKESKRRHIRVYIYPHTAAAANHAYHCAVIVGLAA